MMLIEITGFLGSGKTTLMSGLARWLAGRERKVAILVNEIGEIGIDNRWLKQLDMNVWELVSGCICCTLAGEFSSTLDSIRKDYDPDLVLIEPSGAADPRAMDQSLQYSAGGSADIERRIVTLVDPLRLEMLLEITAPMIKGHVARATLVVIPKADEASANELKAAREWVQSQKPQAEPLEISAKDRLEDAAAEAIMSCLN